MTDSIMAVVFDMDGVLIDSERVWMRVLKAYVNEQGGAWSDEWAVDGDEDVPEGDNSLEWSSYLVRRYGLAVSADDMVVEVVKRIRAEYAQELPVVEEAVTAVRRLAGHVRLAVASSSPRALIDHVLAGAGIGDLFAVTVSSDEVGVGKPAPDVYLRACSLLDIAPRNTVAVEDTGHGMRAAKAAGMHVLALPGCAVPISSQDLALADCILASLDEVTPALLASLGQA